VRNKTSKAGTAALQAAIAEMNRAKIIFTGEDAKVSATGWHIDPPAVACGLANHPKLVDATDRELLTLLPYLDAATLYENSAFECFGREDTARASDNVRRVARDVPKYLKLVVENTDGKPSMLFKTGRAEFTYVVDNGQCRLDIQSLTSDTEDFFTHLWFSLEYYGSDRRRRVGSVGLHKEKSPREFIRRCKCGRYFVANISTARFCSRVCIETEKRKRYAQSPDRAEDQALSMMVANYQARYNKRYPSKQYVTNWLQSYRQKREGKKSVSIRPIEAVLAKL
jgi:hypothetical protein